MAAWNYSLLPILNYFRETFHKNSKAISAKMSAKICLWTIFPQTKFRKISLKHKKFRINTKMKKNSFSTLAVVQKGRRVKNGEES